MMCRGVLGGYGGSYHLGYYKSMTKIVKRYFVVVGIDLE